MGSMDSIDSSWIYSRYLWKLFTIQVFLMIFYSIVLPCILVWTFANVIFVKFLLVIAHIYMLMCIVFYS